VARGGETEKLGGAEAAGLAGLVEGAEQSGEAVCYFCHCLCQLIRGTVGAGEAQPGSRRTRQPRSQLLAPAQSGREGPVGLWGGLSTCLGGLGPPYRG
jgi:hypothetical protein